MFYNYNSMGNMDELQMIFRHPKYYRDLKKKFDKELRRYIREEL